MTLDRSSPRTTPPKLSTLPQKPAIRNNESKSSRNVQSMIITEKSIGRTPNVLPMHLSEEQGPHPWLQQKRPQSNIQSLIWRDLVTKSANFNDSHLSSYQSSRSKVSDSSLRPNIVTPQPACKSTSVIHKA